MKARTKQLAIEWLKTAKSSDKFIINTHPHSKKEVEALLGVKHEDIKVKEDAGMGSKEDHGDLE